ncbi:hypothetical protein Bbelb_312440 [Branchiostoma belcheri]|nr:hypothetical protein Bbelb_312440 [Branchiostoma belcheri]
MCMFNYHPVRKCQPCKVLGYDRLKFKAKQRKVEAQVHPGLITLTPASWDQSKVIMVPGRDSSSCLEEDAPVRGGNKTRACHGPRPSRRRAPVENTGSTGNQRCRGPRHHGYYTFQRATSLDASPIAQLDKSYCPLAQGK